MTGADKALDFAAVMKLVNSDPVVNAGAGKVIMNRMVVFVF